MFRWFQRNAGKIATACGVGLGIVGTVACFFFPPAGALMYALIAIGSACGLGFVTSGTAYFVREDVNREHRENQAAQEERERLLRTAEVELNETTNEAANTLQTTVMQDARIQTLLDEQQRLSQRVTQMETSHANHQMAMTRQQNDQSQEICELRSALQRHGAFPPSSNDSNEQTTAAATLRRRGVGLN